MQKPVLLFWQIWNMSFAFGIQFGWGLQMANMSAIYSYLGPTPIPWPSCGWPPRSPACSSSLWSGNPATGSGPVWAGAPLILGGAILASLPGLDP